MPSAYGPAGPLAVDIPPNGKETTMKGLTVEIFNGRYSNRTSVVELTLVGEHVAPIFEATPERPAVWIVTGNLPGTVKAVLVDGADSPAAFIARGEAGPNWPMFGGSYIATSDSRFSEEVERLLGHRFYGAVPLHNRYELSA